MSDRVAYLRPVDEQVAALVSGMEPQPVAFYVHYKLVQLGDSVTAVSAGHQDDEETEVVGADLESLVSQIEDRVTNGVSVFSEMEPGGDMHGYLGGPFKFVREVVLVFDLSPPERAEVERLRAEAG